MMAKVTGPPRNPYWVLIAGTLLPGSGHVMLGVPLRGLTFLFFMVLLGWISVNLMPANSSFVGKHIGGIFVYGLSVIDSYKQARISWEQWKPGAGAGRQA